MRVDRGTGKRRGRRWLLLLAGLALAWLAVAALRAGRVGEVEITPGQPAIGQRTPVRVRATGGGRGLAALELALVQGERREVLAERELAAPPAWKWWRSAPREVELELEVGGASLPWLEEGEARLEATARPAPGWLRGGEPATAEQSLAVRLRPPALAVLSSHHYLAQGGSEAVVYRVGGSVVRDGVEAGGHWFPGHPLPGGGPGERFALFAAPYDLADADGIRLVAVDEVDNRASVAFVDRFFPRPPREDTIRLGDRFLERVVPDVAARTPGIEAGDDLLATYLEINGELRRDNAETLVRLAEGSAAEFAWREPFVALPGSQVMSAFADRRTYVYDGRVVDRQDHLGFDLASVRRAPVPAANAGRVVLAEYFGIYGNAVVIDHGYGLASLYGHLSSIDVAVDQRVGRGEVVGRTGQTGLAGGDHLHFTMLLDGVAVDPREWWDAHWIRDRLDRKLGPALPFGDASSDDGGGAGSEG